MQALQALGERLVGLPDAALRSIPLPDPLRDAVLEARRISARGGRRRQLQYVGRLMRETDPTPIMDALARIDGTDERAKAVQHQAEHWRGKLLAGGDDTLTEFIERYQVADRQRLRQLQRAAQAESAAGAPPRHQRDLFRELRDCLDSDTIRR